MSKLEQLEARVAALEVEVERLKAKPPRAGKEGWLEKMDGRHANDPAFEEVVRLGREYRESLRPPEND